MKNKQDEQEIKDIINFKLFEYDNEKEKEKDELITTCFTWVIIFLMGVLAGSFVGFLMFGAN